MTFDKKIEMQREEILSDENLWFAGEFLGHSPSPDEAGMHYANHGGADNFNELHPQDDVD